MGTTDAGIRRLAEAASAFFGIHGSGGDECTRHRVRRSHLPKTAEGGAASVVDQAKEGPSPVENRTNSRNQDTVTTLYRTPRSSPIKVREVDPMRNRNKAALWAAAALVLIALFVVSALAKSRSVHRTLYDRAATGMKPGSRPISGEAKPSAAVGVVGPLTKKVGKSKQARRTAERPPERPAEKETPSE